MAASKGLSGRRMAEMFARYGTDAEAVGDFITAGPDAVLPHAGYSMRELQFLIRGEAVEHLDDLLLRRTTLAVSGENLLQSQQVQTSAPAVQRRVMVNLSAGF